MARYNAQDIGSGFGSRSKINDNFNDIESTQADMLSRKAGDDPNQMETELDMNSNRLINVPDGVSGADGVNLNQVTTIAQNILGSATATSNTLVIASVAAMKVLDLQVGQVVATSGYFTAGDGGGATYVIVAPATGTDDGGSYIDLNNTNQANLYTTGDINVKQFGVVAGYVPGATSGVDGLDQIQAANDYAASINVGLFFPPGNYYIDVDSIVTNALNVTTDWTGYGATIYASFGRTTTDIYLLTIVGQSNLKVRGLTIDGQVTRLADAGVNANLDLATTTDITADDYTKTYGAVIRGNSVGCEMIDCTIRNVLRSSFRIDFFGGGGANYRNSFTNCVAERNRGTFGDSFFIGDSRGTIITGCKATDFTRIGFVAEGSSNCADQIIVGNCYASDGHDAVTTENNAGFWYEGAQTIVTSNCIANSTGGGFLVNANSKNPLVDPASSENLLNGIFQFDNCTAYAVDTGFVVQAGSKNMTTAFTNCKAFVAGVPLGNFPAIPANFGFFIIRSGAIDTSVDIKNCYVEIDNAGYATAADYGGVGLQDSSGDTANRCHTTIDGLTTYFVDPTKLEADATSGNGKGSVACIGSVHHNLILSNLRDINSLREECAYISLTTVLGSQLTISDSQCCFVKNSGEFETAFVSNCRHLTTTTGNIAASNVRISNSYLKTLGLVTTAAHVSHCTVDGKLNIQVPSHTPFDVIYLYHNRFSQDLGVAAAIAGLATNTGRTAYCYCFGNTFFSTNGATNTYKFIELNNGNFSPQGDNNVFDTRITNIATNTVSTWSNPLTVVTNFTFGEKRSLTV